jgi:hypothetical protein
MQKYYLSNYNHTAEDDYNLISYTWYSLYNYKIK